MHYDKGVAPNGKKYHMAICDSLADLSALAYIHREKGSPHEGDTWSMGPDYDGPTGSNGALDYARELARTGWGDRLEETLDLISSAVDTVEGETDVVRFRQTWGVEGCDVDVGRYLDNEPECMIDYPLKKVPTYGRVITLLASVCYSASIRSTELIRRGTVLAAFAMALSRLGYSVELWAEAGIRVDGETGAVRTLVKGAHDHLDPAHILYAYAHPSMLRQLCFRASGEWARHGHRTTDWAHTPMDVVHNMPEGTIYLPEVTSMHDYDCATELKKLLDIIGLIEE